MAVGTPVFDAKSAERTDIALALKKKPRLGESIIQGFLLLCGVLSIITTVGIVVILGNESLNFFRNTLWEDTNKHVVAAVANDTARLQISESGNQLSVGDIVRLGGEKGEQMEIIDVQDGSIIVKRGMNDTAAVFHPDGSSFSRAIDISVREVLTGSRWQPQLRQFGMWPLILATLMTSVIAMCVALPLGLATAIYLSEYASRRSRNILKPILEVLAGIPTVVYGYFALTFITPLLRGLLNRPSLGWENLVGVFNMASAGIVVGILIIPLVSSMSEDALSAVPSSLRQAAYGLGATKLETATRVVLPGALSGITAAFVVAISRAIGETMIVAIAAGASTGNFDWPWQEGGSTLADTPLNPFMAAETMTGHIVRISGGDISYQSIDYQSIFAIGLFLFLMTLVLNIISRRIVARFREVYD